MGLFDLFRRLAQEERGEPERPAEKPEDDELEIYSGMRVEVTSLQGQMLFVAKLTSLRGNTAQLNQYSEAELVQEADDAEPVRVCIRGYNDHERKAVYMEGSISPRATLSGQERIRLTASASSSAPVVSSPGAVGTREETSISIRQGRRSRQVSMARRPSSPATLAISIRSAQRVVVPLGTTRLARASGESMVDSKCMWLSIRPGRAYCPPQSMTSLASSWASGSMETIRLP